MRCFVCQRSLSSSTVRGPSPSSQALAPSHGLCYALRTSYLQLRDESALMIGEPTTCTVQGLSRNGALAARCPVTDHPGVRSAIPILPMLPLAMLACAHPSASGASEQVAPVGPVISRLVPDHGPAGEAYPIRVVIEGRGFAPAANTIRFGPVMLSDLPSEGDGTRILFFVPKVMPAPGEAPPRPLLPDAYEVTVMTLDGTSAPARFTLQPAGR